MVIGTHSVYAQVIADHTVNNSSAVTGTNNLIVPVLPIDSITDIESNPNDLSAADDSAYQTVIGNNTLADHSSNAALSQDDSPVANTDELPPNTIVPNPQAKQHPTDADVLPDDQNNTNQPVSTIDDVLTQGLQEPETLRILKNKIKERKAKLKTLANSIERFSVQRDLFQFRHELASLKLEKIDLRQEKLDLKRTDIEEKLADPDLSAVKRDRLQTRLATILEKETRLDEKLIKVAAKIKKLDEKITKNQEKFIALGGTLDDFDDTQQSNTTPQT